MSALLLILFNLYLKNWIYLSLITVFILIYTALFSFAFLSTKGAIIFLLILISLYIIRMKSLAARYVKDNDSNYPVIKGKFRGKHFKFRTTFFFPLAFLKILKLIPKSINREISKEIGLGIELSKLIDLILEHSKGTKIDITNEELELYFEIQ